MRGIGTIRGLKGAVLVRGLRHSPVRFDGFGGYQAGGGAGGNNGSAGAVPVGGGGGAGPGTSPPPVPPPPAPGPTPQPTGGQPGFGTAPSPGAPGLGQPAGQPQPQPGQNPNLVPQPGQGQPQQQPQNPLAVLSQLPPQALAYVQQLQRQAQWAEQNRFYAQLGYQQWLRQQQGGGGGQPQGGPGQVVFGPNGQPLQQPQRPANPFNVPTFDLNNLNMLRRNPQTGQYEAVGNAPPGLEYQAEAYHQAVVQATHNFFQDPEKYLGELIDKRAEARARAIASEQLGGYQQQQFAQQTLQENAPWMYEKDAAGQVVMEWDVRTGQAKQKLSPWGQEYARRVFQLHQHGITDGRMQHELAIQGLQNLAWQMRQQAAAGQVPAGQQPQNQGYAGGQPAALPGQQQQYVQPGTPPGYGQQQPGLPPGPGAGGQGRRQSLREELSGIYSANGFTDQAIAQGVQGGFGAGFSSSALGVG